MRRRTRIVTSSAAATALFAGAGVAIASVPHPAHSAHHTSPATTDVAATVDVGDAQARALAAATDVAALQRAIAAAEAELNRRRAAAGAAQPGAPGSPASSQAPAPPSVPARITHPTDAERPPSTPAAPGGSSQSSSTPPPVQATTGASGSSAPTDSDDRSREPGDD